MNNKINKDYKNYRKQTQRVRGGLFRSEHGETSEAIFMNSGYTFQTAEEARDRFAGVIDSLQAEDRVPYPYPVALE